MDDMDCCLDTEKVLHCQISGTKIFISFTRRVTAKNISCIKIFLHCPGNIFSIPLEPVNDNRNLSVS